MKPSAIEKRCWTLAAVLVWIVLGLATAASAQVPSIEGTYKFISRQLPDGTVVTPPDIIGLLTYTKSYSTFNIAQRDATGKFRSHSRVATYTLTATEYSETYLFDIVDDQIRGKAIVYKLSGQTRSVPVTVDGQRIQFRFSERGNLFPGRPTEVFEGDKMTATADGGRFVDIWEKVQ
jgi:hypothetical protein